MPFSQALIVGDRQRPLALPNDMELLGPRTYSRLTNLSVNNVPHQLARKSALIAFGS